MTLTLTRWPSHTNLTRTPGRYTYWCANTNLIRTVRLSKVIVCQTEIHTYIHTDRQTDRIDGNYTPRRFAITYWRNVLNQVFVDSDKIKSTVAVHGSSGLSGPNAGYGTNHNCPVEHWAVLIFCCLYRDGFVTSATFTGGQEDVEHLQHSSTNCHLYLPDLVMTSTVLRETIGRHQQKQLCSHRIKSANVLQHHNTQATITTRASVTTYRTNTIIMIMLRLCKVNSINKFYACYL